MIDTYLPEVGDYIQVRPEGDEYDLESEWWPTDGHHKKVYLVSTSTHDFTCFTTCYCAKCKDDEDGYGDFHTARDYLFRPDTRPRVIKGQMPLLTQETTQ